VSRAGAGVQKRKLGLFLAHGGRRSVGSKPRTSFDHNDPGNLERFFGECIVLFGGLAAEEHEMGGEATAWRMR
jgi:hypothetical protein